MPNSPANVSDHTLRVTVKSNGTQIPDTYPIVSINTFYAINRIPTAEIVLIDGSVEASDFPISESDSFLPGAAIEISAGFGDKESLIFKGIVIKQSIKISPEQGFNLLVTCKHELAKLTYTSKEAIFKQKKDSDIISAVIGEHGLQATVTATTHVHEAVFQKQASDWDFILSRVEFSGFLITYTPGVVKIGKPEFSGSPVLDITFGESIISFDAELSAERQPSGIEASGWDIGTLAALKSSATEPDLNAQGNVAAKSLANKVVQPKISLTAGTPMAQAELKIWADAQLLRKRLAALKGSVTFIGNAGVSPGNLINLLGVGDRFNGKAYVSAVEHQIQDGSWTTTTSFGLADEPISSRPDFSYPAASGLLPAIQGLQIGVVKKLSEDPLSQFRIQVTMSTSSTEEVSLWARVSNFYATGSSGISFMPEVGDEVVLGFFDSNPDFPVILGSLYSSKNKSAYAAADENNYIKAIATKSKLKISFDDEKKIVMILTPGGNSFTLDDDAKSVDITDQNNNSIKMTSSGIEIKSAKDINLKATGNITLDATGKLNLKSKQDVTVEGLNIKNTANIGFSAKGNATAEVSASGQTTIKGAMVMIN